MTAKRKRLILALCLLALWFAGTGLAAEAPARKAPSKTFVFHNCIRDPDEFRAYCAQATRLKPYGAVQVDLGVLAARSPLHKTSMRSPWHEYGAYMATAWAFFPPPRLAPFLPAEWVTKNRDLLLAKVAILREFGLEAVFSANETQFLPEPFFRKYPHLRGPRVDNPVRANKDEFSWCIDQPETLEMIEWMTAELIRHAPEIRAFHSWNNDSGSGICWMSGLYPGPNGPMACRGRDMGLRFRGMMEAMDRGARKSGGPIHVRMAGNISAEDEKLVLPHLPSYASLRRADNSILVVKTRLTDAYPVCGLIDVAAVLEDLEKVADPQIRTVDIDTCQSWYYRAGEPVATVQRLVDIVQDALESSKLGPIDSKQKLRVLAARWAGENRADRVVDAFQRVRKSFEVFSSDYFAGLVCGGQFANTAAARLLTRPLVAKPELLTSEEEAYFLPYIFSAEENDARMDYKSAQGGRRSGVSGYRSPEFRAMHDSALEAAAIFEQAAANGAPEGKWFRQFALSLRLWASTVRSHDNFYFAQEIRDRHKKDLAAAPRFFRGGPPDPDQVLWKTGPNHPELLFWNEILRDEFDNAEELRVMLENGGLELLGRAAKAQDEDSFTYGPDILGPLKKKVDIMRAHWLDGQRYLLPPQPLKPGQ